MKEIEILLEILDPKEKVLEALKKFELVGTKNTEDLYFFDEFRTNLQPKDKEYPKEWFRIRKKGNTNYITYKEDLFEENGEWSHSEEEETEIKDFEIIKKIIEKLGFKELVKVRTIKHIYKTDEYEIVYEEVENLGNFLEVESLCPEEDVSITKKQIKNFIDNLNLKTGAVSNLGKPEMILRKHENKTY